MKGSLALFVVCFGFAVMLAMLDAEASPINRLHSATRDSALEPFPAPHALSENTASAKVQAGVKVGGGPAPQLTSFEAAVFNWWRHHGSLSDKSPDLSMNKLPLTSKTVLPPQITLPKFPIAAASDLAGWIPAIHTTLDQALTIAVSKNKAALDEKTCVSTVCSTIHAGDKDYCESLFCPLNSSPVGKAGKTATDTFDRITALRADERFGNALRGGRKDTIDGKAGDKLPPSSEAKWEYMLYAFRRQGSTRIKDEQMPCHFMTFTHIWEGDFKSNPAGEVGTWDEGGAHVLNKLLPIIEKDRWGSIQTSLKATQTETFNCYSTKVPTVKKLYHTKAYETTGCWADPKLYSASGGDFKNPDSGPHKWKLNALHESKLNGVMQLFYETSQPHDYLHLITMEPESRRMSFATMFPQWVDTAQKLLDVLQAARDRAEELETRTATPKLHERVSGGSGNTFVLVPINGKDVLVEVTYSTTSLDDRLDIAALPIPRTNTVFPSSTFNVPDRTMYAPHKVEYTYTQAFDKAEAARKKLLGVSTAYSNLKPLPPTPTAEEIRIWNEQEKKLSDNVKKFTTEKTDWEKHETKASNPPYISGTVGNLPEEPSDKSMVDVISKYSATKASQTWTDDFTLFTSKP